MPRLPVAPSAFASLLLFTFALPNAALAAPAASPAPAAKKATGSFEDVAAAARPAGNLALLVEPLIAECSGEDAVATRRCNLIRASITGRINAQQFIAVGDSASVNLAPYDAAQKEMGVEVAGCLSCLRPLSVDGKQRFLTTRVPRAIKAGKAVGLDVSMHNLPFADAKTAEHFSKQFGNRLRTQFVFKLGAPWKSGGGSAAFEGISFVPVAHRVFDRCTGKVYASEPASSGAAPVMRDASCPESDMSSDEKAAAAARAALPLQLSRQQIERSMAPAQEKAHECYAEFEVGGTATVRVVVNGEGQIESIFVQAPFDKTPTGYCVRTAVKPLTFPQFRGEKMVITYPFQLR